MIITNHAAEKIRRGDQAIGIWSIINSTTVVEIAASTGLDFQILDLEHGNFNLSDIADCVAACTPYPCSPLVRVPSIDPPLIQKVLDMGCHGIVFPQVRNASDAKKIVASCRFAPEGIRGYNPFTRSGQYEGNSNSAYYVKNFPLVVLIIENRDAYANLDDIASVGGVDVLYLGVYDMSCALGIKGQLNHPDLQDFMKKSAILATNHNKAIGVMVDSRSDFEDCKDSGTLFGVLKPDTWQLFTAIRTRI